MSRPRRLPGFDYTGYQQYFLTICTFERRPLFLDAACAGLVLDQFLHASQKESVELTAYCFMPDHVRAKLVQRPEDYPHWGSSRHTREEILEAIQGRDGWRP